MKLLLVFRSNSMIFVDAILASLLATDLAPEYMANQELHNKVLEWNYITVKYLFS